MRDAEEGPIRKVVPGRSLKEGRLSSHVQTELMTLRERHRQKPASERRGTVTLFTGAGTGKAEAAEALAGELGVDLYRIDLSSVVGKFIGETEKNLDRLLAQAEEAGAVLFFDEADALFGKRSEVKDSHDRYASSEVNHLLRRIEGYSGVVILATNLQEQVDDAFVGRLRTVDFPMEAG